MSSIKLTFHGVTRRISVNENENWDYSSIISTAAKLFALDESTSPHLVWTDEEGDAITVSSDMEFLEAIKVMKADSRIIFKFEIKITQDPAAPQAAPASAPVSEDSPIHTNVTCDGCGMKPIIGIRYKCTVRDDFDYCSCCEAKMPKTYPMKKIYSPEQSNMGGGCGGMRGMGKGGRGMGRRMMGGGGCGWGADWMKKMAAELGKAAGDITVDITADKEINDAIKASIAAFNSKMNLDAANTSAKATETDETPMPSEVNEETENIEVLVEDFTTWHDELSKLSDMGFTDAVDLLPLLNQHLGWFKYGGDESQKPSYSMEEGLQRVVAAVLKKSEKAV